MELFMILLAIFIGFLGVILVVRRIVKSQGEALKSHLEILILGGKDSPAGVPSELVESETKREVLKYFTEADTPEICQKILDLSTTSSPTPSLLKLTAFTLPQHLVNSCSYLEMGKLYRLDQQFIGKQMSYGSGVGSSVMGADGKVIGHNPFMPDGIPWGLFLYQAGTIVFAAGHLAAIFQSLGEIHESLTNLSYRFNFRGYSSAYGNYLLLQEISGYLREHHTLKEIHRIQLALIGKNLAADKIYYFQMMKRVRRELKNNKGDGLREYIKQQSETLFMDIHGLYLVHYSSILYSLLIGSADASQKVKEYNEAMEIYGNLNDFIGGVGFETLFLSNDWWSAPSDWLATKWANTRGKYTPKEQREAVLQDFRESLPTLSPIQNNIAQTPEIYVMSKGEELLVYTPIE